jgi:hypothetical protein
MKMFTANQWVRTTGIGLLFACLGFSYSMATTTDGSAAGRGVGSRAIGSSCTRPQTVFVTDTDLGVVVVGTQFTRQILVRFGFKPHKFYVGAVIPSSDIEISESGTVSGTKKDTTVESFEVKVTDVIDGKESLPVSKIFTIRGVASITGLPLSTQFVSGPVLPVAVANEPYTFTIHSNGGNPPYAYEFVSDSDYIALPVGLAFNLDTGEISGKPVVPTATPANFSIRVRDSLGATSIRTFSLTVLPGTITSDFIATSGSFKLNFGKPDSDSLNLSIILNRTDLIRSGILKTSDLTGLDFAMIFGGVQLPPTLVEVDEQGNPITGGATLPRTFDKNGKLKFPDLFNQQQPVKGYNGQYNVKLNAETGLLNVNFKNMTMIKTLGANFNTFRDIIPVAIKIGDAALNPMAPSVPDSVGFDKTDVIKFDYKRRGAIAKGSAKANDKRAPAGLFLITKAQGVERQVTVVDPIDPTKFTQPDRIFLKLNGFLKQVGGQPITFGTNDQVSILFGDTCIGDFPASSLKRVNEGRLELRNDDASAAGLFNLIIDNAKGTIYIDTHGLNPRTIFGQDILVSDERLLLPVTFTITSPTNTLITNALFDGQSSIILYRKGNSLRSKN